MTDHVLNSLAPYTGVILVPKPKEDAVASKRQEEAAKDVIATQAYRLGYKSYMDGVKAEECVLHATDLRQAWANGWSDAHDDDKNERADEQVDASLGD